MGRKVTSMSFPRINWKMLYVSVALFSLLMLIFYVYSVNKITESVLVVRDYNKQIDELSRENSTLEASLAQVSFWGNIMEGAKELNFEKTSGVKYLQIPVTDSSLAKVDNIR